jgi:Raf kinase inhibitor-like YbhB/YbcL family protein
MRCLGWSVALRSIFVLGGAGALCTMGCTEDERLRLEGQPTDSATDLGQDAVSFALTSAGFDDGGEIPEIYTCDGEDVSPPLAWNGVPAGTESLALIVDDPDAPDPTAPERIWVHWLLYDIPPTATELPEAVAQLPSGTLEGTNDWGAPGYRGPCPPTGRHRYFFRLYALESALGDLGFPEKNPLVEAMGGLVIGRGELMGTYE